MTGLSMTGRGRGEHVGRVKNGAHAFSMRMSTGTERDTVSQTGEKAAHAMSFSGVASAFTRKTTRIAVQPFGVVGASSDGFT